MNNHDRQNLKRQQIAAWQEIWKILLEPAREESELRLVEPTNEGGDETA